MPEIYETADVELVAYLKTRGKPIVNPPQKRRDGKVVFEFEKSPALMSEIMAYYNEAESSKVLPKVFFKELSAVKALLHNPM